MTQPPQQTPTPTTQAYQQPIQQGSPQSRPIQPPTGGQQPPTTQPVQQVGMKFEDHLSNEVLTVLRDFRRLESLSAWCAEQCLEMGGQLKQAARTCHDVTDFAHLGVQFMSRNPYRQFDIGEFMLQYLQRARQELAQYQSEPVRQTVEAIDRALASMRQALTQSGQQGQGQQTPQQPPIQ